MEVRGIWPEEAEEIRNASVVDGTVDASGNLKLITHGGQQKNAGKVVVPLAAWPVGSIFMNTSSTNPATFLGGGEWERFGKGRVLLGVDENDPSFNSPNMTGGQQSVQLTAAQSGLPVHNHGQNPHDHGAVNGGNGGQAVVGSSSVTLEADANANPNVNVVVPAGSIYEIDIVGATATNQPNAPQNASEAHPNLQPYITVYMWRRTS